MKFNKLYNEIFNILKESDLTFLPSKNGSFKQIDAIRDGNTVGEVVY